MTLAAQFRQSSRVALAHVCGVEQNGDQSGKMPTTRHECCLRLFCSSSRASLAKIMKCGNVDEHDAENVNHKSALVCDTSDPPSEIALPSCLVPLWCTGQS